MSCEGKADARPEDLLVHHAHAVGGANAAAEVPCLREKQKQSNGWQGGGVGGMGRGG